MVTLFVASLVAGESIIAWAKYSTVKVLYPEPTCRNLSKVSPAWLPMNSFLDLDSRMQKIDKNYQSIKLYGSVSFDLSMMVHMDFIRRGEHGNISWEKAASDISMLGPNTHKL